MTNSLPPATDERASDLVPSEDKEPVMLDVHPPHAAAHSWRDIFIHLATITVGLFIALSLEGMVEAAHHRQLVREARETIQTELDENQKSLAKDETQLDGFEKELETDLALFNDLKAHKTTDRKFSLRWEWDGMKSAAWDTAHNTGAVALMPYEAAQQYSTIYSQQQLVNEQANLYIRNLYRVGTPLGTRKLAELQPAEIDAAIANAQQTMTDVLYLRDLIESLKRIYQTRGQP